MMRTMRLQRCVVGAIIIKSNGAFLGFLLLNEISHLCVVSIYLLYVCHTFSSYISCWHRKIIIMEGEEEIE